VTAGLSVSAGHAVSTGLSVSAGHAVSAGLSVSAGHSVCTSPAGVRTEARDSWLFEPGPPDEALVSPMLRDTPRTWAILRTVLETVARHRGAAWAATAADIHVGLGGYTQPTLRQHMAVARIVGAYQDVLYRLGTNPRDVRRRGPEPVGAAEYSALPNPADGYAEVETSATDPGSGPGPGLVDPRIRSLSFATAARSEHNRFVFGFFDGSLEPGVLQAHVKLALALACAGLRLADEPDLDQRFARTAYDAHRGTVQPVRIADGRLVPAARTVYELDQASDTARIVELLGTVFRRDADLEQQLSVAALTPWPGARAVLGYEGALRVAELFVPASPQAFDGGFAFLPAGVPRALYERNPDARRIAELFARRPFRVLAGVGDDGAVTVFDGLEVTPVQFATLLRRTGWRPESGLLLTFVRLAPPGRAAARQPLPPPLPEDWPQLLAWARQAAADLQTCVHVSVAANTRIEMEKVPEEVLTGYQAFGSPEAARLLEDWRVEAPTCDLVLRYDPGSAVTPPPVAPLGRALVPLPDDASGGTAPLVSRLRQALVGLPMMGPAPDSGLLSAALEPAADLPAEPYYSARPDLFDAEADRVAERLAGGAPPLAFELGGAPGAVQPFSLVIEFTAEPGATEDERAAAMAAIRAELTAIRPAPWSLEPSAAAANANPAASAVATLVSPILTDEAPAWRALAEAVAVVRRNGGAATPGTTGRIRIDLADFAGRVGPYQTLLTLIAAHRETLHRLGTDPTAVARQTPWRPPAIHEVGAVEFPAWDGSLDEAVLQIRVRIWLGLAEAARRLAAAPGLGHGHRHRPGPGPALATQFPAERTGVPAGTRHRVRHPQDRPLISGRFAVLEPGPAEETAAARRLLDTALSRRADRERAAALFHLTPWPGARLGRVHAAFGEGWAVFGPPAWTVPARRVAAHAAALGESAFVAGLGLDPRRAVPVVHGGMGTAAVSPERFARLLAEAGRPPESTVALWLGDQPRRDLASLTSWTRALAGALAAPVYLDADGAQAAKLPRALVEGATIFARPDAVRPGLDWSLSPPREVWLRFGPGGDGGARGIPAPALVPLPDHRLQRFIRDASWQGAGSDVVFATPSETVKLARQIEALDRHDLLSTAVFARSRGGIPQVSLDGSERGMAPAEFAAVLFRHAGATPGAELRLVVLDAIDPDDEAWRRWADRAATATRRTVHYAAPGTSILMAEARHRRRSGGPHDYRLISEQDTDVAGPRWRVATPGGAAADSRFTDDRGWLRPADQVPQEERRWPVRRSGPAALAG
jgi:hypothetical protein